MTQQQSLNKLNQELGISPTFSKNDSRVILNYSQIESPKLAPIVRECRALVLDSKDWSLVSRSFFRFFNLNETNDPFNYNDCIYQTKEDGSLINVYWWNGKFQISTRASFGDGLVNDSKYTWRQLFELACPNLDKLNPKYTYTFELCSPFNCIVRRYNEPTVYLLSIFDGEKELSFNSDEFEYIRSLGIRVVDTHSFHSCDEAIGFLKECERTNPTYEGFVLRDSNNVRIKLKSVSYLHLHRLHNNGNIASPKNLIPLIVDCEIDEILSYFEYLRPEVDKWKRAIDKEWQIVDNLYFCHWDESSDKKFAQAIIGKTKFTDVLFRARKNKVHPKEYWNSDTIVKQLVKD